LKSERYLSVAAIFREGEMEQSLRTNLSPAIPKVKKRPRGRPFEKGNTLSLPYRFKKGDPSPNPGGRPRTREFNAAAREFAASDIGKSPKVITNVQAMVAVQGRKALKGDLAAATFLAERAEGRPAVSMQVDGGADKISILIAGMDNVAKKIGRPEGWQQPLLEEGEDADK
jgi:hypothetical protein